MMAQVNAGRVRFVGRGEYNNSTQYYVFDLVSYNGNSYYAKVDTIGNLPTNTTYWQLVAEKGNVGPIGLTGNGISSITKTSTSDLVDTYTITFTNGNTTTFDVSNGKGIDRIEKTATVGNIDTYTIYFNDNSTSTFEVANGEVTREELEEEVDRLSMIYNLFPTTSDEDTEMTLDGTGEVKLKKIGLKGNTYQDSTTGSTLSDFSNMEETINGLNIKWNENNMLTLNGSYSVLINSKGTGRLKNSVTLKAGTTYYLHARAISGNYSVTNANNASVAIVLVSSTSNQNLMRNSITCPKSGTPTFSTPTYTPSEDIIVDTIQLFVQYAPNDIVYNNFKVQYCLTTDTTPKYEPYTNGPSPNPDYSQDIQVVTGDNEVKVEGKNLCNGITQNYFVNQAATRCGYAVGDSGLIVEVDGVSDYTISSNTVQTRYRVGCLNEIPVEGGSNTIVYNGSNKDGTNDSVTVNTNGYKYLVVNATDLTSIQIEKNSTKTLFEEYKSQTYPINLGLMELCKIGDYQDVIKRSSGKNLYGTAIKTDSTTGSSYTIITDTSDKLEIQGISSFYSGINKKYQLQPNTQYTISLKYSELGSESKARIYYKLGNDCENITVNDNNGYIDIGTTRTSLTFTTDSTGLVVIMFMCNFDTNSGYVVYNEIQLEKGNQANSYEPYGKVWYLNKQIGKVVLDGNTTYVKSSGYSDETWFCGYITPNVENFKSGIIAFNNRFQNGMYSVVSDKECMANNRNQLHIRILASRLNENSSSGLSEWFSTHNVEIYYVLATPTITEITDTTLIEQLDNLENAYSYDTQTNITQTNDDMPFILDVEALMSLKGVLN